MNSRRLVIDRLGFTFSQYSSVRGGSGKARSEASTEAREVANGLYVLVTRKVSLTGENPCSK